MKIKIEYALLACLLFIVPVVQLGISYYISFQIFGVIMLLFLILKIRLTKNALVPVGIGLIIFLLKIFIEMFSFDLREILLVFREAFCFSLLVLAIGQISKLGSSISLPNVYYIFLFSSTALIFLQAGAITNGVFISFPFDWYVANMSTLTGVDAALEHGTRLRPVGFYGEPSYMAFVLMSALAIFLSFDQIKIRTVLVVLAFNLFALFLLASLAGALSFLLMLTVYVFKEKSFSMRSISGPLLFVSIVFIGMAVVFIESDISRRVSALFSGNADLSVNIRYVIPFSLVQDMFFSGHLIGYGSGEISKAAQFYGLGSVDNALLGLVLHYGILAPVLIAIVVMKVRNALLVAYILVVLNFNGAYFSFDKVLIMSLTVGLSLSISRRSSKGGAI